ncbi:MAG: recombinase family protein [Methanomassiliicoccales archaeon]|nr:MAG: recombinase family protein [Methanomassiliicoccales archaeon]
MTRAAIYARVSTEDQAKEGYSLDAQKDRLRAYCQAKGWEIADEYIEDGHSGRDTKRPAYQKMLEEKDDWDTLLVIKMDRIHRNSKNFMEMMDDLKRWEKEFSSMQESLDTSTAMGRFVMDIIQRIAQLESEQIGERVYMGMKQKASTVGGPLGGYTPYGYDYDDGQLIVNEEERKGVLLIFEEYLAGRTTREIANLLNFKDVPKRTNTPWFKMTVSRMLRNPVYCGYKKWDEILRKADHQEIIDVQTFNEVQKEIVRRIRRPSLKYEPRLIPEVPLLEQEQISDDECSETTV